MHPLRKYQVDQQGGEKDKDAGNPAHSVVQGVWPEIYTAKPEAGF